MRLRVLPRREEQRVALERCSVLENNRAQLPIFVRETLRTLDAYVDAVAAEALERAALDRLAVGEHDDVGAPRPEPEREAHDILAGAKRCEAAVPPFPPVAVRTMKHGPSVARVEAGHARQIVDDAGRNQDVARVFLAAARERDAITVLERPHVGDADASEVDAVR